MLFELNEEQRLIRDTARDFAEGFLSKYATQIDREKRIPPEVIKQLTELGFWGVLVPEELGGAGLNVFSLALILEEISRVCASTSVTLSVHNSLTCNALLKYGTAQQKQKYLPRLARGEIIGAYAITEAGAGSDIASLATKAEKQVAGSSIRSELLPAIGGSNPVPEAVQGCQPTNRYLLNGSKLFITNAPIAGLVVIFARTHPDKTLRGKGISAFLVEPQFSGFHLGSKEEKMGIRGAIASEIVLEDCAVPADNLLGEENKGYKMALEVLDCGRIGIAAQSVGIAQACLDASLKYSHERKQFGKAIAEFQAIQWKLAEMATDINAARFLTYHAATLRDKGLPHIKEASMAKLFASTMCNKAAKEAVQIHGGMGYTKDFPIERFFRDAKVTEIYEGTSEVQKIIISRELLNNK